MAIPTSALARTGASLIPSPVNASFLPSGTAETNLSTSATLPSGSRPALYSSTPVLAATSAATSFLSPVSITVFLTPLDFSAMTAAAASSLILSETTMCPAYSPSMLTWTIVPLFSQSFHEAPVVSIILLFPTQTSWPLTMALTPCPATSSTASTLHPSASPG